MNNLISIIVPIYNAEKYLADCVESILSQTYENLEVILINDGSTDNSLKICNYYKSVDNRIVLIDKPNEGVSSARNHGIEIAKGEYIGFVDSDDFIKTNMYEFLLKRIQNDKTQVCAMTSYSINNLTLDVRGNYTIGGEEALEQLLLLRFPTSLWAFLYKKDTIKNIRLNSDIHFFEDFEFNFRVLSTVNKISICDQRLYNYRENISSANNSSINYKRMTSLCIHKIIIEKLEEQYKELVKYAIYFKVHCIISIIACISKSEVVDIKYYSITKKHARNKLLQTLISNVVPLKYKIAVLLFSISPKLLTKSLYRFYYNK
jgi:glycosyltransferase involved in cell wall biosynthesis